MKKLFFATSAILFCSQLHAAATAGITSLFEARTTNAYANGIGYSAPQLTADGLLTFSMGNLSLSQSATHTGNASASTSAYQNVNGVNVTSNITANAASEVAGQGSAQINSSFVYSLTNNSNLTFDSVKFVIDYTPYFPYVPNDPFSETGALVDNPQLNIAGYSGTIYFPETFAGSNSVGCATTNPQDPSATYGAQTLPGGAVRCISPYGGIAEVDYSITNFAPGATYSFEVTQSASVYVASAPLPAAALLFGSGLSGLLLSRKKLRNSSQPSC